MCIRDSVRVYLNENLEVQKSADGFVIKDVNALQQNHVGGFDPLGGIAAAMLRIVVILGRNRPTGAQLVQIRQKRLVFKSQGFVVIDAFALLEACLLYTSRCV